MTMSIRKNTPCDLDGVCPYEDMHSGYFNSCEYWCGADEPQDNPALWSEEPQGPEFWPDESELYPADAEDCIGWDD